jgi:hypothetical protein
MTMSEESKTPRTDADIFRWEGRDVTHKDFSRILERELNAAKEGISELNQRLIERTAAHLKAYSALQEELRVERGRLNQLHKAMKRIVVLNDTAECLNPSITMIQTWQIAYNAIISIPSKEAQNL